MHTTRRILVAVLLLSAFASLPTASAAKLTIDVGRTADVTFVGAFNRWDIDGNPTKQVNPKAKIDAPEVDAVAQNEGDGRWTFSDLAPGTYDLVIMTKDRQRFEGFTYPPVLEFDPFYPPDSKMDEEVTEFIVDDIQKARHYENKVVPLYIGGDGEKTARVLVMLIRDKPTSYEGDFPGAATMRFEVWQYDWQYGGWVKNRRTRVLHRVIMHRDDLRKWTWLWDAKLGGIEVKDSPITIEYQLPKPTDTEIKGLRPY